MADKPSKFPLQALDTVWVIIEGQCTIWFKRLIQQLITWMSVTVHVYWSWKYKTVQNTPPRITKWFTECSIQLYYTH